MLEIFKMAERERNPEYSEIPLTVLMEEAAKEAGWHLEFVENLRNTTKYQVRYKKPFDSEVVAELLCRMKPSILSFLQRREIDYTAIDSYLGWGIFNFIKTYKPDVHNTEDKIKSAIYRSVQNKVDQCNRKEIFRFRPISEEAKEKDPYGKEKKHKYVSTAREVSYNTPVFDKNGNSEESLNFIEDPRYLPTTFIMMEEEYAEIPKKYSVKSDVEKLCIDIMLEAGYSGKITLKDLKREVIIRILPESSEIFDKFENFEENTKGLDKKVKMSKVREFKKDAYLPQMKVLDREIKAFYRRLKASLLENYKYIKD